MDITPLIAADRQVIQGYGPEGFRVSGKTYTGAILVFPTRVVTWAGNAPGALTADDFADITPEETEILLFGGGHRPGMPPAALRAGLKARGIALDVMDTGAACRTYNVLLADGRRVAAALLPV